MLECRYKGHCRIEYDTDFDVCYPCIGDWGDTCARYKPMPDVEALTALADEMKEKVLVYDRLGLRVSTRDVMGYARRIREALGVDDA